MKKVRIFAVGATLAGGIALSVGMANEASAQFFPRPHLFGGYYSGPVYLPPPVPRRPVGLGASEIFEDLRDQGFSSMSVASRRPDVFVIDAIDRRNQAVRLVVDAFDGEILERFARRSDTARTPDRLSPDRKDPTRSTRGEPPAGETSVAELPAPPRRPGSAAPSSGALPALRPAPVAPPRSPADWAPLNSVPVAPLE